MHIITVVMKTTEHGRLCLITFAGVDLNIFLIERNVIVAQKDDVLLKDDIAADRNFSVLILTEWAMRNASKSIGTNSGSATLSSMTKIGTISDCQMNSQEVRLAIARSLRIDHGECRNPSKQSPRWREGAEGSGVLSKKGVSKLKVQGGSFPSSSISSAKDGDYLRNNGSDAPKRNLEISSPTAKKRHDSDAVRRDTLNTKGDFGSNGREKEMQMLDGESARSHSNDGAYIPSIALTLLSERSFRPMKANSPKPIPFENDVFVGKLLLLVNTKPICDQYLKRFEGSFLISYLLYFFLFLSLFIYFHLLLVEHLLNSSTSCSFDFNTPPVGQIADPLQPLLQKYV